MHIDKNNKIKKPSTAFLFTCPAFTSCAKDMVPLTISSIGIVYCRTAEFEKITESFVILVSEGMHLPVTVEIENNSRDTKIQSWLEKHVKSS